MTQTQMRKLANQIVSIELVIDNPDTTKEQKDEARSQISQIAMMLTRLPHGFDAMAKIEEMASTKLESIQFQKEG